MKRCFFVGVIAIILAATHWLFAAAEPDAADKADTPRPTMTDREKAEKMNQELEKMLEKRYLANARQWYKLRLSSEGNPRITKVTIIWFGGKGLGAKDNDDNLKITTTNKATLKGVAALLDQYLLLAPVTTIQGGMGGGPSAVKGFLKIHTTDEAFTIGITHLGFNMGEGNPSDSHLFYSWGLAEYVRNRLNFHDIKMSARMFDRLSGEAMINDSRYIYWDAFRRDLNEPVEEDGDTNPGDPERDPAQQEFRPPGYGSCVPGK